MKVTLSLEETASNDVSIMVDALRASSTITVALNKFKKIIPCFTPEEAFKLKDKTRGIIAGERGGKKIEGFDIGNTPTGISKMECDEDILILTTNNGTRILEKMNSKVLVGSMINARATGIASLELAEDHIDVVMAGVNGEFAIEDYLAAGEILYQICEISKDCELSEYAQGAILASRDYSNLKEAFTTSRTAKRLKDLGYSEDVEYCCQKNINDNVAIYNNDELTLYI